MRDWIMVLRVVHIVAGVFWVGAALFNTFYLFPALRGAGPAAGAVMAGLQRRRLMTVLPITALVSIVSGLVVFWLISGGAVLAYSRSPMGGTLAGSAVLAIAGFLVGILVMRPAAMESGRLGRELGAVTDDVGRSQLEQRLALLQRRSSRAGAIMSTLLLVSVVGMAVARYV